MILDAQKFIDTSKNLFDKTRKEAIRKALLFTGAEIMARSIRFVPIDEGTLTGSAFIVVKGKKTERPFASMTKDKKNLLPIPEQDGREYVLKLGYATTYARRLHENDFKPGAKSIIKGLTTTMKYLERVLGRKKDIDLFKKFLNRELNK